VTLLERFNEKYNEYSDFHGEVISYKCKICNTPTQYLWPFSSHSCDPIARLLNNYDYCGKCILKNDTLEINKDIILIHQNGNIFKFTYKARKFESINEIGINGFKYHLDKRCKKSTTEKFRLFQAFLMGF
jgi:hypothetical protein